MAEQPLSLILKSETLIHENDSHNQYHFAFKSIFVIAVGSMGSQIRRAGATTMHCSPSKDQSDDRSGLE